MNNKYNVNKKEFIKLYNEFGYLSQVAKKMGISWSVANHRRKQWGIDKKQTRICTHSFNENYLDKIDNDNKAFWLGFLFGNSSISERKYRASALDVQKHDKKLLEKLKKDFSATNEIIWNGNGWIIRFTSNHICNIIKNYGRTSKIKLLFPNINQKYHASFINGFIQANSSIFLNRGLITLDIHGPENFLEDIKKIFACGGSIRKPTKSRNGYGLRYSGPNQIKTIRNLGIKI